MHCLSTSPPLSKMKFALLRSVVIAVTLAFGTPAVAHAAPDRRTSSSFSPTTWAITLWAWRDRFQILDADLDRLSQQGVRFTDGYVTAPQCSPSRAGLLTGRYQQRFGFDSIPDGPLPLTERTLAEHLREAGYVTGMVGKWHLQPNPICLNWARKQCPDAIVKGRVRLDQSALLPYYPQARGFEDFLRGTISLLEQFRFAGQPLQRDGQRVVDSRFRVDVQTEAGLAFLGPNVDRPFFLYLAYYAHTCPWRPLGSTSIASCEMPERRRTGLAMMSAVDEGVGRVMTCSMQVLRRNFR